MSNIFDQIIQCQKHEHVISSTLRLLKSIYLAKNTRVKLNSNNQRTLGDVSGYDLSTHIFHVLLLSGEVVTTKCTNLEVVSHTTTNLRVDPNTSLLATELTPGMRLNGEICIPDVGSAEAVTSYTIGVIPSIAAFNEDHALCGIHSAYSDSQAVVLRQIDDRIYFNDQETFCAGKVTFSDEIVTIEGTVSSTPTDLKEDALNRFALIGTRFLDIIETELLLYNARLERVRAISALAKYGVEGLLNSLLPEELKAVLENTRWKKEVPVLAACEVELVCSWIREITRELNQVVFQTYDERWMFLEKMRKRETCRAEVHRKSETSMETLNNLVIVELKYFKTSAHTNHITRYLNACKSRLEWCLQSYDKALSAMEKRLPKLLGEELLTWERNVETLPLQVRNTESWHSVVY